MHCAIPQRTTVWTALYVHVGSVKGEASPLLLLSLHQVCIVRTGR